MLHIKRILRGTAIAFFLFLNNSAFAAVTITPGGYLGLQMGYDSGGMMTEKGGECLKHDLRNGFSGRMYAGYLWPLKKNFSTGIEFGVSSYPDNEYEKNFVMPITTDGVTEVVTFTKKDVFSGYFVDLLGFLQYTFNSNLNVYGKLGIAGVNQEERITADIDLSTGVGHRRMFKVPVPEAAIGVSYNISEFLALGLDYICVFGQSVRPFNNVGDYFRKEVAPVSALWLSLTYHFNWEY